MYERLELQLMIFTSVTSSTRVIYSYGCNIWPGWSYRYSAAKRQRRTYECAFRHPFCRSREHSNSILHDGGAAGTPSREDSSPGPLQYRRRKSQDVSKVPQLCAPPRRPAAAGNAELFQRDVYANGAKANREHEHSHLSTRPLITPLHTQVYTRTHKRTRRGFRRTRLVTKPLLDYLEVIFPA